MLLMIQTYFSHTSTTKLYEYVTKISKWFKIKQLSLTNKTNFIKFRNKNKEIMQICE